jgi:hypothetical protein
VLEFYAIEAPLAQPRNAVLGQIVSSIVGVATFELFRLSPNFESIRWLGAALSCASATALMALTGTVHPPGGATAVIAVIDDNVAGLRWWLVPVVLFSCALMQTVALLLNNIQRRFPVYWWTPQETGALWKRKRQEKKAVDGECAGYASSSGGTEAADSKFSMKPEDEEAPAESVEHPKLVVTRGKVVAPNNMYLRPEEITLLQSLSQRL